MSIELVDRSITRDKRKKIEKNVIIFLILVDSLTIKVMYAIDTYSMIVKTLKE